MLLSFQIDFRNSVLQDNLSSQLSRQQSSAPLAVVVMFKYIDNPAAPLVVVNSYHCCIQIPPKPVMALNYTAVCTYMHNIALQHVYLYPAVQELSIHEVQSTGYPRVGSTAHAQQGDQACHAQCQHHTPLGFSAVLCAACKQTTPQNSW